MAAGSSVAGGVLGDLWGVGSAEGCVDGVAEVPGLVGLDGFAAALLAGAGDCSCCDEGRPGGAFALVLVAVVRFGHFGYLPPFGFVFMVSGFVVWVWEACLVLVFFWISSWRVNPA